MNNLFLTTTLLLTALTSFTQIPDGYYNSAFNLSGEPLKTALHNIIDDHIEYTYSSSNTDVWDILKESDKDTSNAENVILFYSGWSVNASQEYNSGKGWNREHVWAKSRGDFGTTRGAGTDLHNLKPTDISVNSARNNRWFDEATIQYIDGDGETNNYISSTRWVWEPRDEVKGDVARIMFYMATRYEGDNNEVDLELIDTIPSDNNTKAPFFADLSTLLQWHIQDPVDDFERNRNEVIFSYQNNRNPFIDHPEYVQLVWGTLLDLYEPEEQKIMCCFPNPTHDSIMLYSMEVSLYSIIDSKGNTVLNNDFKGTIQVDLSSLDKGVYSVVIIGEDGDSNNFKVVKW